MAQEKEYQKANDEDGGESEDIGACRGCHLQIQLQALEFITWQGWSTTGRRQQRIK